MDLSTAGPPRASGFAPPLDYLAALTMTAAALLAALAIERVAPAPNLSLVFVLPVVICAVGLGWGPALLSVVAGAVAYNFFLIEPRYTLRVADPANVLALVLMLVVAALVSWVAGEARRRAMQAWRAADQATALNVLARGLVGAGDPAAIGAACAEALSRLFGAPAAVMLDSGEALEPLARAGGAQLSGADEEAARWCLASGLPTRGGAYPVAEADYDWWPVVSQQRRRVAVGLRISGGDEARPEAPQRLVEIVGGYLAVALDRAAYAAEATEARVRAAGDRVRADLLAAVSHDLKTPLSTVLFALQSLQKFSDAHAPEDRAELLALAERETARLQGMVANLLDVNRIEAGAVAVMPASVAPAELVSCVLQRLQPALQGRQVSVRLPLAARPLQVDPALFETALANVLENAAKYSGDGAIEIRGGEDGVEGWIEVLDDGPGFAGPAEPMFEKFARGVQGDGRPPGVGLGLAIARSFLEAQGGRIEAADRPDRRGARVRLAAPLAANA